MHPEARKNLDRCESCAHFRSERFMEVICAIATGVVTILDASTCPLHGGDVPQAERVETPCVKLTVKGEPVAVRVVAPVPRDEWPLWASAISKIATEEDIGVGSTVDRLLGRFGVAYKATLKAMGVPCGCAKRKEEWDAGYGY